MGILEDTGSLLAERKLVCIRTIFNLYLDAAHSTGTRFLDKDCHDLGATLPRSTTFVQPFHK